MRVVIHKEGFAIEAFTFLYWNLNENKSESSSLFKDMKMKKKVMLKLERKWEMKKWRKSENEESDYVQMSWERKSENDLEEVVLVI